jgi:hypothetical protein
VDKRRLAELLVKHKEKAIRDHAFTPREILSRPGDMTHQKEIHIITGGRRSGKLGNPCESIELVLLRVHRHSKMIFAGKGELYV